MLTKDQKHSQHNLMMAGSVLGCLLIMMLFIGSLAPPLPEKEGEQSQPPTATQNSGQTVGTLISHKLGGKDFVGPSYYNAHPWSPPAEPAWAPSQDFTSRLQAMLLPLIFICLLIWATLKLLAKTNPSILMGRTKAEKKPLLQVVEEQKLGAGRSICLVDIAGKLLVVGMTEQGMNPLCELSRQEFEAYTAESEEEETSLDAVSPRPDTYREILKHYASIIPGVGAKK